MVEDLHDVFSRFKGDYPEVYALHEQLGEEIHERGGPLPEKTRWLLKVAISAAGQHHRALETHLHKARAADLSEAEILHALLLLIPTTGFPTMMEAYQVYRESL